MKLLIGAVVLTVSTTVHADEYRLFVNDAATCASYGFTGSVCVVPVTSTPTPEPAPVPTPVPTKDCVVTTWNPCTRG